MGLLLLLRKKTGMYSFEKMQKQIFVILPLFSVMISFETNQRDGFLSLSPTSTKE